MLTCVELTHHLRLLVDCSVFTDIIMNHFTNLITKSVFSGIICRYLHINYNLNMSLSQRFFTFVNKGIRFSPECIAGATFWCSNSYLVEIVMLSLFVETSVN